MLAGRLCLWFGIADVVAWRDSLDGSRVLDFWEAFNELEPVGLPGLDFLLSVQTAHLKAAATQKETHPDDCKAIPDYAAQLRKLRTDSKASTAAAEQSKFMD